MNTVLSTKFEYLVMSVAPQRLISFPEIVQKAGLSNNFRKEKSITARMKKIFSAEPISTKAEEIVLYYEGENQTFPNDARFTLFREKGYEVVVDAHPSLLVEVMTILTEEKLVELGIPHNVHITIPTSYENSFKYVIGDKCFPYVFRSNGIRKFYICNVISEDFYSSCAFLLRKVAQNTL